MSNCAQLPESTSWAPQLVVLTRCNCKHRKITHAFRELASGFQNANLTVAFIPTWFTCEWTVNHQSSSCAQCRATMLIDTNMLPLHHAAIH